VWSLIAGIKWFVFLPPPIDFLIRSSLNGPTSRSTNHNPPLNSPVHFDTNQKKDFTANPALPLFTNVLPCLLCLETMPLFWALSAWCPSFSSFVEEAVSTSLFSPFISLIWSSGIFNLIYGPPLSVSRSEDLPESGYSAALLSLFSSWNFSSSLHSPSPSK